MSIGNVSRVQDHDATQDFLTRQASTVYNATIRKLYLEWSNGCTGCTLSSVYMPTTTEERIRAPGRVRSYMNTICHAWPMTQEARFAGRYSRCYATVLRAGTRGKSRGTRFMSVPPYNGHLHHVGCTSFCFYESLLVTRDVWWIHWLSQVGTTAAKT